MSSSAVISAPHVHDRSSVRAIMVTVIVALLPCTAAGIWAFGWPALTLLIVTVGAAVGFEALALWMMGSDVAHRLNDGSAILAGWLLALTLPPWAPWWIGVVGSLVAMLLAKHAFGGIGQNVFNPAMVARVVLLIAFPLEMSTWPEPMSFGGPRTNPLHAVAVTFGGAIPDGLTGATLLTQAKLSLSQSSEVIPPFHASVRDLFLRTRHGSLGEVSMAMILLGGAIMLWRRVISWHVPVGVVIGLALPAIALHAAWPTRYLPALAHVFSGASLLVAIFIATDPTTSPSTGSGKIIYALGIGLIMYVIRTFCSLPEGAGFAVLLMNAVAPTLDRKLKPRVYGRKRSGVPLTVSPREASQ